MTKQRSTAPLILLLIPICVGFMTGCARTPRAVVAAPPPPPPAPSPSRTPPPPPPSPPPSAPAPATAAPPQASPLAAAPVGQAPSRPLPLIPTRDFLAHDAAPFAGYGAFGYVLFNARPVSKSSRQRYLAACEAYLATLEPDSRYLATVGANLGRLMPTYWLVTEIPAQQTCDHLIQSYDFARAKPLLSLVGRLAPAGPILAAWDTVPDSNVTPKHQLILDLSDFSDEDMERAFEIWIQQFAQDPSLWQHGFDVVRIKESFRNLLQKYGGQILEIVNKPA